MVQKALGLLVLRRLLCLWLDAMKQSSIGPPASFFPPFLMTTSSSLELEEEEEDAMDTEVLEDRNVGKLWDLKVGDQFWCSVIDRCANRDPPADLQGSQCDAGIIATVRLHSCLYLSVFIFVCLAV